MGGTITGIKGSVAVQVAEDLMSATVMFLRSADGEPLSTEAVVEGMSKAGIEVGDTARERAAEYVQQIEEGKLGLSKPFLVAEGVPPKAAQDEKLVWDESFEEEAAKWRSDAPVDYYSFNSIITVEKDALIGSIAPSVPACDGKDIKGNTIPCEGKPVSLALDGTVYRAADDKTKILATISGRVVEENNVLKIEEVLHIPGDVDFGTGNVDAPVEVRIAGRVPDRFSVKSKGSVVVGHAIEAAKVTAGGDIIVGRGILGRNQGLVSAEGTIVAKFTDDADLVAGGDVKIARQVMNSRLFVGGSLDAANASLVGGVVFAREGGTIASLGSNANVPTRMVMAVRPEVVREWTAIDKRISKTREMIQRIRDTLKPVLDDQKSLSTEQERSVSTLLAKVDDAGSHLKEDEKRREELMRRVYTDGSPRVSVSGIIHARVAIRFGDRETYFHKELKGPVSIEKRKIKNVTEIVSVNLLSGTVAVLKNERRPLDDLVPSSEESED